MAEPFAVISDIHGNWDALENALAWIKDRGLRRILCLGDVIGYGPEPVRCLSAVREVCEFSLRGNHDVAAMIDPIGFNPMATQAANWTKEQIRCGYWSSYEEKANWRMLETAPEIVERDNLLFVHASPRDPVVEYVLETDCPAPGEAPNQKLREIFQLIDGLTLLGHSHRPGVIDKEYHWHGPEELGMVWKRNRGKAILNVGSIGQPRDGIPKSTFVTVDDEEVRFHRLEYDVQATKRKIHAISDLDNRLGDRLELGR